MYRANACPCCRETLSTADSEDIGSSLTTTSFKPNPRRSRSWSFSSSSNVVLFSKSLFSFSSSWFSSSNSATKLSSSVILAFLRSRAVCAATRFFNFLRIMRSSGVRCVSRLRFLGCPSPRSPNLSISMFEAV